MKRLIYLSMLISISANAHVVMGILQGKKEIVVKTRSQGELLDVNFEEGQEVKAGDVLGKLDNQKEIIEKKMAYDDFVNSKDEYQKTKQLRKYVSKDELKKKKTDLSKKESLFKLKEFNLESKNIVTPIDGILTKKFIKRGENIGSGVKAFEIIQFDELNIDLHVAAKYLGKLKEGKTLNFIQELDREKTYVGEIYFVSPVLDKASGTVNVKLRLKNKKDANGSYQLRPGAMVKVSID